MAEGTGTMILEGVVTSLDSSGAINVAPMGPIVGSSLSSLTLRPFRTSQTYANLKETGQGVFHVTDDVLLIARAAIGAAHGELPLRQAEVVTGRVLASACRWYEFRITEIDDRRERTTMIAEIVHCGRTRDFFGFNRGKHAVLEAAILATRVHLIARSEIERHFNELEVLVEKTGGDDEHTAFALLRDYVHNSFDKETSSSPAHQHR